MIESSVWNEAIRRGRAQGLEPGQVSEDRRLCLDRVRDYHPRLVSKLRTVVQGCTDSRRLSDADFAGLVCGDGH